MIKTILPCLLMLATICSAHAELDFGDHSSSAITTKAWEALNANKPEDAVTYTQKCIKMFEADAIKMQKELKAPVEGENDAVSAKWALNDVGTCYFILGQALEKQKKGKAAMKAYKELIAKVSFAQCWDPNGWFWQPADAAKERIAALEFDDIE